MATPNKPRKGGAAGTTAAVVENQQRTPQRLNRRGQPRAGRYQRSIQAWASVLCGVVALLVLLLFQHLSPKDAFVPSVPVGGGKATQQLACEPAGDPQFARLQDELLRQDSGADVARVRMGTFNGIRGLQTTVAVAKGGVVLSVPLAWSISAVSFAAREYVGGVTQSWRGLEDADIMLDVLALMYERYVRRGASRWASYLCVLPEQYSLPVNYTSADATVLMAGIPELQRLVDRRRASIASMAPLVKEALTALPGGRAVVKAMDEQGGFMPALLWAYAATKTRTVQVDLSRADGYLHMSRQLKSWVREVGAMVPILDLANHASEQHATAHFAVRLRKAPSWQRWLPGRRPGGSLHFALLAARDLKAGEEVTFSYLPEDDDDPRCSDRWLLEYGFALDDGLPGRGCFKFNITALQVASIQLRASQDADVSSGAAAALHAISEGREAGGTPAGRELLRLQQAVESRLRAAGLPDVILAHVTRDGKIASALGQWLSAAVGGRDEDAGWMWAMLLHTSQQQLHSVLQRAHRSDWVGAAASAVDSAGASAGGASKSGTDDGSTVDSTGEAEKHRGGGGDEEEAARMRPVYEGALAALQRSLLSVSGQA